jgi:hypothetical protein
MVCILLKKIRISIQHLNGRGVVTAADYLQPESSSYLSPCAAAAAISMLLLPFSPDLQESISSSTSACEERNEELLDLIDFKTAQ